MPKEKKEKKISSKPWMQDNNPFGANSFRLRKKHVGFTERFVHNDPGNIAKHEDIGRIVAKCTDYGYTVTEKHGTALIRGDSILMEMPDELAKMRKDFYEEQTDKRTKAGLKKVASDVANTAKKLDEEGIFEAHLKI